MTCRSSRPDRGAGPREFHAGAERERIQAEERERLRAYGRRWTIWREAMTAAEDRRAQRDTNLEARPRRWDRRREVVAWTMIAIGVAAVAWFFW